MGSDLADGLRVGGDSLGDLEDAVDELSGGEDAGGESWTKGRCAVAVVGA